ncbi:MAG TPA: DUF4838 domain-containing protein [Candidatus Hydrogenedentes bacterium]|nr:DUF4838 domain-containing protein [Candidatus Hydrogenedentota bacterium]
MLKIMLCASIVTGIAAADITLVENGASPYAIAVSADPIPAEQTAARELQAYLAEVTGCTLEIISELESRGTGRWIMVGPQASVTEALPNFDWAAAGHDGIVMKTAGDNIILAGGRPRGTLYAVYTFLEDVVGCRWWSSTEQYVPKKPTITIPPLDVTYTPKLRCREAFYRDAFDGTFAARCKCNGHFERIPEEYGGHYTILGWCHTFYQLLPPEEYFEAHPEWYSEIDGKRVKDGAQLCLTNDEMRAEFTKKALEWIRRDPSSGIISISQNDWHGWCTCPACRAVEEEEGAHSGPIIRFVNRVAEDVEKEFPDMLIETLAYSYTREAPKLARPRDNVVVRLCSIECSYSQPLGTGPQNETFKRDMDQWSAMAHHLYIWDYVTNFCNYIQPHPNMRVLAPNIRFFIDHKAIGLFEQGDSGCSCSDFPELRAWVLAHLMWNPDRDENALINEFLDGYYGPAAQPLRQYIDLIHNAVEASGIALRCYMPDTSSWFTLEAMNRASELFDEAERVAAGDPALVRRVQRARMPLDHAWLGRYHALRRIAAADGLEFRGPKDPVAACDQFIERAHAFNVGSYREGAPFEQYEPLLRSRFRPPCAPPEICANLPESKWIDVQDNEFRMAGFGNWSTFADDAKASDGKAARMPASHHEWAVQYPCSADWARLGAVRCYILARCNAKAASGNAFQLGIYDSEAGVGVANTVVRIEDSAGESYRTFDLGVHALTPSMYFWVAPMGNPEEVDAVYVDRMFCVQEP